MKDLLSLVYAEKADALEVHVGSPPVILLRGEDYIIEGPSVTPENAQSLFREIASSRDVRELASHGETDFMHRYRGRHRFAVRAKMEFGYVGFDVFRINSEPGGAGTSHRAGQ